MLALIGGVFCFLMWKSYASASETRGWEKTSCMIIRSDIGERSEKHISPEYCWRVEYTYTYGGKDYFSTRNTIRDGKDHGKRKHQKWTGDKKVIEQKVEDNPKGSQAVCYVNPQDPAKAVLEHETKAAGYSIWFPGLFVIGGLGIIVGAVKGMTRKGNDAG